MSLAQSQMNLLIAWAFTPSGKEATVPRTALQDIVNALHEARATQIQLADLQKAQAHTTEFNESRWRELRAWSKDLSEEKQKQFFNIMANCREECFAPSRWASEMISLEGKMAEQQREIKNLKDEMA